LNTLKLLILVVICEFVISSAFVFSFYQPSRAINSENLILKDGLIFIECDSLPFTGKILDTLENNMTVEITVANGLMNGQYLLFDVNGKVAASGFTENNKNSGTWQYFYHNGQLQCKGNYFNDKPTGKWIWYYANGLKKCEGFYLNGTFQGRWIKYDGNGFISFILNYQSGELINFVEVPKPIII
jgi:antitoxin component YwqK of YwqJK toxin-antitoxin module